MKEMEVSKGYLHRVSPGAKIPGAALVLVIALFFATLLLAHPAPEVSLEVVSPNGGEMWRGEEVVKWVSSDIEKVDIWFSGDNGVTWLCLAQDVDSLDPVMHQWRWDTTQMNDTSGALINISSRFGYGQDEVQGAGYGGIYNPSLYYDLSNSSFTVDNTPPVVTHISATPLIQEAGDRVSLSANISDNMGMESVILSLQFPNFHWKNIPLDRDEISGLYVYNRSYVTVGVYNYSLTATDQAGNLYQSPWQSFAIEDTTVPHVELIYPVGGEILSGEVKVRYNISDNSDASFNESIDLLYSPDGGATWSVAAQDLFNTGYYRWNTTLLPDGRSYHLRINATDQGGNVGWNQTTSSLTLDNSPPEVELLSPHGGTILPDLVTIIWTAWDTISPDANLSISLSYSPDSGGNWTSIISNISNTGLYVYNTQQWHDGNTYLLCVTATDGQGNQGHAITETPLIKDAHPPQVTIARPHEGWLHFRDKQIIPLPLPDLLQVTLIIGRFTVQIDAFDYFNVTGIGHIDIYVDQVLQETLWEKPYQWEWHGSLGKHTLSATAYDYAGNYATTSQDIYIIALPPEQDTPDSPLSSC